MKTLLTLCLFVSLGLLSCKKTSVAPASSVGSLESQTVMTPAKSNFDYIIAHTWQYNKYYIGYVDSAHLGTLVYKRGRAGNTYNLDNDFVTYYADGTIMEDNNGTLYPGKWKFDDPTQTVLRAKNSTGVYIFPVLLLNNNHWNWKYHAVDNTERYAEMGPRSAN